MKTPKQIAESNKIRDEIIRILEDRPGVQAVYPLLHYMESEMRQVEEFWENAHAHTECKLNDKFDQLNEDYQDLARICNVLWKMDRSKLAFALHPNDYEKLKNHIGV